MKYFFYMKDLKIFTSNFKLICTRKKSFQLLTLKLFCQLILPNQICMHLCTLDPPDEGALGSLQKCYGVRRKKSGKIIYLVNLLRNKFLYISQKSTQLPNSLTLGF